MSLLDGAVIVTVFLAALWWGVARRRAPGALEVLSLGALALAVIAPAVEGLRWQLVPWQLLALAVAAATGLRRLRPGLSRRWSRGLGRLGLIGGVVVGGLALLTVPVPVLPQLAGPYPVGSQVFRWTDAQRPEIFTPDPQDQREVIAQAWYPAAGPAGARVPYFEAQGRLPGPIDLLPPWFFQAFGAVDTHATAAPPVSAARPVWPILLFLTGLGEARESYTALCTDLASRGYVVVALSVPYESAVTVLAEGRIVGQTVDPFAGHVTMGQLIDVRAGDSRFVLDQLSRLAQVAPGSPLIGHLDLPHVGIIGHSVGGATASQVIATDSRFQVGGNMDGTLFDAQPSARLSRPFLWMQSDGFQSPRYLQVRDQLLGGLQAGGALLIVGGSLHEGFTDFPAYLTAPGRDVLGGITNSGSVSLAEMTAMTGDTIAAFVGPLLAGPSAPSLEQVVAQYPALKLERRIARTATR